MSRTPDLSPTEHAAALAQLERLVRHHGSQRAAARVLGTYESNLSALLAGTRYLGRLLAARIAAAARQVTKHADPAGTLAQVRLGVWPAGERGYRAAMLEARRAG